jgi:hypothetical protein
MPKKCLGTGVVNLKGPTGLQCVKMGACYSGVKIFTSHPLKVKEILHDHK